MREVISAAMPKNPSGEPIPVGAKVLPVFKVGRTLRAKVGDDG